MDSTVTQDQLKTLLLKCVGSRYPVKIKFTTHEERQVYVKGFMDAACNEVLVANTPGGATYTLDVQSIRSMRTIRLITFERLKGCNFRVN